VFSVVSLALLCDARLLCHNKRLSISQFAVVDVSLQQNFMMQTELYAVYSNVRWFHSPGIADVRTKFSLLSL